MKFQIRTMLARLLPRTSSRTETLPQEQTSEGRPVQTASSALKNLQESGNHIQHDQALAKRAMTLSNECSLNGWHSAARALAIDSVIAEPGSHRYFRQLGQLLHSQGKTEYSRDCLKGRLPDGLLLQHLDGSGGLDMTKNRSAPDSLPPAVFERVAISASEQISISAPLGITGDPLNAFARSNLQCAPTWIDRVVNGHCWHDTNHTLVLDSHGQTIEGHTVGSELLPLHITSGHPAVSLGKRVCVLGARGGGNYFHWMTDILPKLGICEQAGIELNSIDRFVLPIRRSSFQLKSLAHLGIAPDRVYFTSEFSPWISADELLVPHLHNALGTTMQVAVPHYLQRSFLGQTDKIVSAHRKLFISRDPATSEGRSIHNLDVIEGYFMDQGFEIFYPERHSISVQAKTFSDASVVIGIHGAGMTNIVFCQKGTIVVEFYGEHVAPCYWAISRLLGLKYHNHCCASISCLPGSDAERALTLTARRRAHFSIEVDDAIRVLGYLNLQQD